MTMTPVGDKGQRYEIAATGYPFEGKTTVCGWVDSRDGAERMMASLIMAPNCRKVEIRDRWKRDETIVQEKP